MIAWSFSTSATSSGLDRDADPSIASNAATALARDASGPQH